MPPRAFLACSAFLCLLVGSHVPADAQYVYALSGKGRLTLNGTVLDELSSEFEVSPIRSVWEAWIDLHVDGSDRYALRRDGKVQKNGEKDYDLPWNGFDWVGSTVNTGTLHCIRQDGMIAGGKTIAGVLDRGNFLFRDVVFLGGNLYSLRTDGVVFRNTVDEPVLRFKAGTGVFDLGDGEEADTVWVAIRASGSHLYALRADGKIHRADPNDLEENEPDEGDGDEVGNLPFPGGGPLFLSFYYSDLEFTEDGLWLALRADGSVYSELNQVSPLVDYPGDGEDNDHLFFDLATFVNDYWAVRSDGKHYKNTSEEPVLAAPSNTYDSIALSAAAPDLSNFENAKPVAAVYATKTVVGTPLALPVMATDTDKATADLVITPVDPLPPGAAWDAGSLSLIWDNPGPAGKHTFEFLVDDGVDDPVSFTHTMTLVEPSSTPEKNKPPLISKIKKGQAVVGEEFAIAIIADDPEGDAVSITVDTFSYPFNTGATFDPSTRTFAWTPTYDDQGTATVYFFVSDGINGSKKTKVKLKIKVGIFFAPP